MTISSQLQPTEASAGYAAFLLETKNQIRQRQFQALRVVRQELLELYGWLGENISQRPKLQPLVGEISTAKTSSFWRAVKTIWTAVLPAQPRANCGALAGLG